MKVISGKYKGKKLDGFNIDGTRPTMDRVKESVFASIQDYIRESVVLDLYAGSGNLAIEALSNGAKKAYLVDISNDAIKVINNNIKSLNIDNAVVLKEDAKDALINFINNNKTFDIIFLDPPYETDEIDKILSIINDNISLLSQNGLIVCETTKSINYDKYTKLKIYKCKKYGVKCINILKIK